MATATVKTQLFPQPPILTPVPDKEEKVGVTLELTTEEAKTLLYLLGRRVTGRNDPYPTSAIFQALYRAAPFRSDDAVFGLQYDGTSWTLKHRV